MAVPTGRPDFPVASPCLAMVSVHASFGGAPAAQQLRLLQLPSCVPVLLQRPLAIVVGVVTMAITASAACSYSVAAATTAGTTGGCRSGTQRTVAYFLRTAQPTNATRSAYSAGSIRAAVAAHRGQLQSFVNK